MMEGFHSFWELMTVACMSCSVSFYFLNGPPIRLHLLRYIVPYFGSTYRYETSSDVLEEWIGLYIRWNFSLWFCMFFKLKERESAKSFNSGVFRTILFNKYQNIWQTFLSKSNLRCISWYRCILSVHRFSGNSTHDLGVATCSTVWAAGTLL